MPEYVEEPVRKTEVAGRHQVVVVGGGTGGVVAAIACARQGVDTLIVEQLGYLGGSQTAALVTPMMRISPGGSSIGGINEEIRQRMLASGDMAEHPDWGDGWFNPEALKYVLEHLCLEAGVKLRYYSTFCDVVKEGAAVRGIMVESKSGREALLAERVIDSTADADVAVRAGAPFESGRKEDGLNQAMSLRFNMGGVYFDTFCRFLSARDSSGRQYAWPFVETAHTWDKEWPLSDLFRQGVEEGVIEEEDAVYFQLFSMPGRPGEVAFNCPRILERVKGHSAGDLTYAQIVGKQKIRRLAGFCRKYFPGFENAFIALTAPMVGVRETRRIVGDYVFSGEDVAGAAKFPDAIARGNYPMDIHQPKGTAGTELKNIPPGEYYEIPYRCLIPKRVENLLVIGRCLSATFEGQSAMRVQGIVRTIGEAAGYAMAVSVQDQVSPREIDVEKVRRLLGANGVKI